jgi:hypothetical protein
MSAFREALQSGGHGEWIVEASTASGEVRLRKVQERKSDVRLEIAADAEDTLVLQAA